MFVRLVEKKDVSVFYDLGGIMGLVKNFKMFLKEGFRMDENDFNW